jgi:hypothetical protein
MRKRKCCVPRVQHQPGESTPIFIEKLALMDLDISELFRLGRTAQDLTIYL